MGYYKIGTAARLTGLDVATLRNWEQRYRLVVPRRSDGRQRLYSGSDLDQLSLVKLWVERGYSASEAHALVRESIAGPARPGEPARVRDEARRVRALVAATHARAADEQARAVRTLNRIASEATGNNADRLRRLADQAAKRHRRTRTLAKESAGRSHEQHVRAT